MFKRSPMLTAEVLIWQLIEKVARTGTETPCAAGFTEFARDIGPLTFLWNGEHRYSHYIQVQLYGHPMFTAFSDQWYIDWDIGKINIYAEPTSDDTIEVKVTWKARRRPQTERPF